MKGEGQPDRLPGAESGWYHEAREAFVPEVGRRLLRFQGMEAESVSVLADPALRKVLGRCAQGRPTQPPFQRTSWYGGGVML